MRKSGDVLFLDPAHHLLFDELEAMGYRCLYEPEIDREELLRRMPALTGIIVRSRLKIDEGLLASGHKLRFVGRVGSGLENIDVQYAESKGITCLNSPEGNRQAVGEHAVGLLLSIANNICVADKEVRQGIWRREENRGFELSGKTAGIIGYGNTGSAFAECLRGFGMRILAYDKYRKGFGTGWVRESGMKEIYNECDILSLHVPLTEETMHLVNRQYISRFKKRIVLINTARGAVVNTSDLTEALRNKKVLGAGLDVLEYEHLSFEKLDTEVLPGVFQSLATLPNVVLTPHVAGWTKESKEKLATVLADKIRAITP